MALLDLWNDAPVQLRDKQIHQLIAFAGAGKLLDGSPCSIEFRSFLASVGSRHLSAYVDQCLSESFDEVERLVAAATACLGRRYDLRNLFDLGRYLLPLPHLPVHWRRRALALGSGDPSRAICSTLIAELFQSLRYPILHILDTEDMADTARDRHRREVLHIRDHRLYAPRDFDISPYFEIVKPALHEDFDYHRLAWGAAEP